MFCCLLQSLGSGYVRKLRLCLLALHLLTLSAASPTLVGADLLGGVSIVPVAAPSSRCYGAVYSRQLGAVEGGAAFFHREALGMAGPEAFLPEELGLVGWTLSKASFLDHRVEELLGDPVVSWAYAATS